MAGHAHDPHGHDDNVNVEHEDTDINVRAIIWFAVILAAIVLTIDVAMYGTFRILDSIEVKNDPGVSPVAMPAGQLPPEPRLQTTPWADLQAFKAGEMSYIHGYGWVDQQQGVAHIPIERAKALLLQRGLPSRAATGPVDATEGTHAYAYGESNGGRNLPAAGADLSSPNGGPNTAAAPSSSPSTASGVTPNAAPAAPKPGGGGA